ncbi:uncharacterized protein J3R85_001178 [Psidium guajava]|nr:uncharacterized protein J3R85_001178 [Psidium guajava]
MEFCLRVRWVCLSFGETLELLIPSYSLDLHPFIRKRAHRYGSIFRTNLAGRPLIVSVDPEFNNRILQQEGRLIEMWYFDIFAKLFAMEGESRMTRVGLVHKYIRRIFLNHFGSDILREKLLEQIEEAVERSLRMWSNQPCTEVKLAASAAEHARILERREGQSTALCWDEYKSMTFTMQVVNETLRLGNAASGLIRRAVQDIPVNGFMIPKGWPIMVVRTAFHMNHDDLDSRKISKNFMPFGGGMRQCVGAEYTRAFLCAFIHVLVTKFRWAETKIGDVYRSPILNFKDGVKVKLSESRSKKSF